MIFWIKGNTKKVKHKKWTNREYRVKNNEDVKHQDVRIYFATTPFTNLTLCGLHNKPHFPHMK